MEEAAHMPGEIAVAEMPFEDLVSQYRSQVLRCAYRMMGNWADAEDASQETFVRLYRSGPREREDSLMKAWLYRVTVNVCLDRLRQRRTMLALPELPSHEERPDAAIHREEQKRRLHLALGTLAPRERAAVILREIEGLTTSEVAAALGSSEGTVRGQISKALVRLRECMSGEVR